MRISIRGFLTLRRVMHARAVFDYGGDSLSVDGLLRELSLRYGEGFRKMIFEPDTHTLNRHIRILVNGRHYSHLPQKLNTPLQEGDEVCLFPPIAGG